MPFVRRGWLRRWTLFHCLMEERKWLVLRLVGDFTEKDVAPRKLASKDAGSSMFVRLFISLPSPPSSSSSSFLPSLGLKSQESVERSGSDEKLPNQKMSSVQSGDGGPCSSDDESDGGVHKKRTGVGCAIIDIGGVYRGDGGVADI